MDSTKVVRWDGVRVFEWVKKWLDRYAKCREAGEHIKGCCCKTGPPMGVLLAVWELTS